MKDQRQPTPAERVERTFARRLRELRNEQGLSQSGLAARLAELGLKLDDLAILRIEKNDDGGTGARRVRLGEATMIARALGVRLDEMLRRTTAPTEDLERARAELEAASANLAAVRSAMARTAEQQKVASERVAYLQGVVARLMEQEDADNSGIEYVEQDTRLLSPEERAQELIRQHDVSTKSASELRERFMLKYRWWKRQCVDPAVAKDVALLAYPENLPESPETDQIYRFSDLHRRLVRTSNEVIQSRQKLDECVDESEKEDLKRKYQEDFRQFAAAAESFAHSVGYHLTEKKEKK